MSGKYIIISINASSNLLIWSNIYNNISTLTDYSSSNIYNDKNGKSNTNKIVTYSNSNGYTLSTNFPAVNYCKTYSPGYKNGEWYLPSMKELQVFYNKLSKFRENCTISNITTNMSSNTSDPCVFWSSTEYSSTSAWSMDLSDSASSKGYTALSVLPFLTIN